MTNEKQFCFIVCYNNALFLNECQLYISMLHVPEGYTIDFISIEGAESMTAGYNAAMQASNAKYKIYLHQDVFILNRYFLNNILSIFRADQSVGMIGMVGAAKMGHDAIMFQAPRVGKVASEEDIGTNDIPEERSSGKSVLPVTVIDGLLLATQYDIPWRQDLFTGWDFYDASQSMEFERSGYKTVVPNMESPWVLHDDGKVLNWFQYDQYRTIFQKEYANEWPSFEKLDGTMAENQYEELLQDINSHRMIYQESIMELEKRVNDSLQKGDMEEFIALRDYIRTDKIKKVARLSPLPLQVLLTIQILMIEREIGKPLFLTDVASAAKLQDLFHEIEFSIRRLQYPFAENIHDEAIRLIKERFSKETWNAMLETSVGILGNRERLRMVGSIL